MTLLQLFLGGSVFLLQSAPQTGVSTVHVTRGTAGSAPDASAFGSARGQAPLVTPLLQALQLNCIFFIFFFVLTSSLDLDNPKRCVGY